jgi:hypothetical protein
VITVICDPLILIQDGDITGIEIADGCIRLIKWELDNGVSKRIVLEERLIEKMVERPIVK